MEDPQPVGKVVIRQGRRGKILATIPLFEPLKPGDKLSIEPLYLEARWKYIIETWWNEA